MGRSRRRWTWVLGLLLLAGVGHRVITTILGPVVPSTVALRGELVQRVVASGRVLPPARISLGSTLVTTVQLVEVIEGQQVKTGQLLLQLQDSVERAALAQARAGVAQAEARFRQVRGVSSRLALETLRQAQADLKQAELKHHRVEALARRGVMSQGELEDASKLLELARSRQESAAVQLASTSRQGTEDQFVLSALAQARAAQDAAEARLSLARIVAPADGVILSRAVEPGDLVQPGRTLLTLARAGATQLVFQPEEKNLALLRVGQPARASADAFPDQVFAARIAVIAPAVDALRGTIEVKLDVPQPPPFLRPDMTVSVEVEVGRRKDAVLLPAEAVREITSASPWVMLIEDGRAEKRPVRIGLRGEGTLEVVQGLEEGARVIPPSVSVTPGRKVRLGPSAQEARGAL